MLKTFCFNVKIYLLFTTIINLGEGLNCTCGRPGTANSRIVNGLETSRNEFPWIVAIRKRTSPMATIPNLPYCAGSLVSDSFVATAAHCLANLRSPTQWEMSEVVLGMHYARSSPPEVQVRGIKRAVMKVQYRNENKDSDIALIELDRPVNISAVIYPICLPYDLKFPVADPWVVTAGWGRTSYRGRQSEVLMKSKWMEMIRHDHCAAATKYRERPGLLTERMLCGVSDLTDACLGDSGGPLMFYHPKYYRWFLVGVTSFGWGCNEPNDPGVYTSLYHPDILGWLSCANTGQMCQN
ncbi:transmembrane protease serine 12-like isoform X2 [Amphibalanus amphitrite]|uniref:transmembrane protease serine 12-like isoform X2 n=1 Tax=Amphibalanus amphitrite TaxID=1232801 RepID=UPI001C904311|nr:transmembrane protease serine 12-like isoform X2 [Amphibalanus amphitrite]